MSMGRVNLMVILQVVVVESVHVQCGKFIGVIGTPANLQ